jgi:hypothetical protein
MGKSSWSNELEPVVSPAKVDLADVMPQACHCLRRPVIFAAEDLFLRKPLALYQERQVAPTRASHTTRIALVWLARWCDWRKALHIVQPDLMIAIIVATGQHILVTPNQANLRDVRPRGQLANWTDDPPETSLP